MRIVLFLAQHRPADPTVELDAARPGNIPPDDGVDHPATHFQVIGMRLAAGQLGSVGLDAAFGRDLPAIRLSRCQPSGGESEGRSSVAKLPVWEG